MELDYPDIDFDTQIEEDLDKAFKEWEIAEQNYKKQMNKSDQPISDLELVTLICYIVSLQYFITVYKQININFLIILHFIVFTQLIIFFMETFKCNTLFSHDKINFKKTI